MVAYIFGAVTSVVSGYIGMYIATRANVRVAYEALINKDDEEAKYVSAFNVAFKGGCVMGFCLVALALFILTALIIAFTSIYILLILGFLAPNDNETYTKMFEFLAGYGLGGSTVALFCRVGGGIYTKAADVGSDLVGKVN